MVLLEQEDILWLKGIYQHEKVHSEKISYIFTQFWDVFFFNTKSLYMLINNVPEAEKSSS